MTIPLRGIATGIGSLPLADAQEAADWILRYCPDMPFWPQLPKRDPREGMVTQFLEGFPCVKVTPQGPLFVPDDQDGQLERFYEKIIGGDTAAFAISADFAAGLYAFRRRLEGTGVRPFVKVHITGPFTCAAALKDEKGVMLLHNEVFRQALVKHLAMKAAWQVETFRPFAETVVVFIDEPYLGCFGSAYSPLSREGVVADLTELAGALHAAPGVLVGVHCCGNTDWSIFTDVPGIDIINFDASEYQEQFLLYTPALDAFLARGGIICWGVVPTHGARGDESAGGLTARIAQGIDRFVAKGGDRSRAEARCLISPACGLGTLAPAAAEGILKLLSDVSAHLRGR